MANVNLFRGGTPDYKPMFCRGEFAEWKPPFSAPHLDDTPPFDSHADAAYGQGWLTLQFPLVPNLWGNDAHHWVRTALQQVTKVDDIMWLNWIPLRSFALAQYIEVNKIDPAIAGVTVKPVANRVYWDWTAEEWKWKAVTEYAAAVTAAGVSEIALGEFSTSAPRYAFINLAPAIVKTVTTAADNQTSTTITNSVPCTFGHNMVKFNSKGKPTAGLDDYYGGVVLGLQIASGTAEKIALLPKADFALYMSTKIVQFNCGTQIG